MGGGRMRMGTLGLGSLVERSRSEEREGSFAFSLAFRYEFGEGG